MQSHELVSHYIRYSFDPPPPPPPPPIPYAYAIHLINVFVSTEVIYIYSHDVCLNYFPWACPSRCNQRLSCLKNGVSDSCTSDLVYVEIPRNDNATPTATVCSLQEGWVCRCHCVATCAIWLLNNEMLYKDLSRRYFWGMRKYGVSLSMNADRMRMRQTGNSRSQRRTTKPPWWRGILTSQGMTCRKRCIEEAKNKTLMRAWTSIHQEDTVLLIQRFPL